MKNTQTFSVFLGVLLFLESILHVSASGDSSEEDTIPSFTDFKTWLKSEPYKSYNKYIFPRDNQAGNVSVNVIYYLVAFTDFDEVSGNINLIGYLTASWKNDLLKWTVDENVLSSMNLPQDNIWRPPIVLANSVESMAEVGHKSYRIRLNRDGDCVWTVGLVTKTSCSIDVSKYPFDKQSCDLVFTPWAFSEDKSSATSPADFKAFLEGEPYISYNLKIFPRVNQNDNVTVDVKMYLIAITDFNEVANQMEVVGYIKVKWLNELLQWTTSEHPNVENIILSQNNLWRPSIVLSNSVDSLFEIGHKSYQIRIDRDGNCEWVIGVVSKTSCAVDISYYPFDKQKCEIIFNPWGFNDNQISLYSTESEIDLTHYMENVEWDIGSTEVTAKSFSSSSYLHFTINLERKPIYFLVNMVIPILILGLLNGLVFLLPSDSGERVSYAITAFLTFAVFLTMVSENLPKASEPMSLLCYFLTLMLVMSALSTIITIMTLRVYHQDEDSDVPKWLRHVIQFVKCRKCKKWCGKKPEPNKNKNNMVSDTNDSLPKKKMFDDDSDSDSDSDFDPLAVEVDDTKGVTWKEVGRTLDILFFFLFMIGTVVITIFFLVPLASAS